MAQTYLDRENLFHDHAGHKRACKNLVLGVGGFRGTLRFFHLWDKVLRHRQLAAFHQLALSHGVTHLKSNVNLVLSEGSRAYNWATYNYRWRVMGVGLRPPRRQRVVRHVSRRKILLHSGNCGRTACDDPRVILTYSKNALTHKLVRYTVIQVRCILLSEYVFYNALILTRAKSELLQWCRKSVIWSRINALFKFFYFCFTQ